MRKIIQITSSDSESNTALYALTDDGLVWEYDWGRKQIAKDVFGKALRGFDDAVVYERIKPHWVRLADIPEGNT